MKNLLSPKLIDNRAQQVIERVLEHVILPALLVIQSAITAVGVYTILRALGW